MILFPYLRTFASFTSLSTLCQYTQPAYVTNHSTQGDRVKGILQNTTIMITKHLILPGTGQSTWEESAGEAKKKKKNKTCSEQGCVFSNSFQGSRGSQALQPHGLSKKQVPHSHHPEGRLRGARHGWRADWRARLGAFRKKAFSGKAA